MKILVKAREAIWSAVIHGVVFPLYRLALRLQVIQAREAIEVSRLTRSVSLQTLWLQHRELPLDFNDPGVTALCVAVYRFFDPKIQPWDESKCSPADVARFNALLESSDESKRLKLLYHQACAHFYELAKQPAEQLEHQRAVTTIDPSVSALTYAELSKQKSQLKKRLKQLHKLQRESRAFQFEIDPKSLAWALPILSALFLVNGYLHSRLLLGHFDIDVATYFSSSDYLAASIEEIHSATISTALGVFWFLWGLRHASSRWAHESGEGSRVWPSAIFIVVAVSAAGMARGIYDGRPDLAASFVYGPALLVVLWISERVARFFTKPLVIMGVVSTILNFVLIVSTGAVRAALAIEYDPSIAADGYGYQFSEQLGFDESNIATITANSEYLFLYDFTARTAVVVPKRLLVTARPTSKD